MSYDNFKIGPEDTTNDWTTLEDFTWLKYNTLSGTIVVENKHATNAALVKVVASPLKNGEDFPIEVVAETNIAAGGNVVESFGYYFAKLRVLIKSASAGNAASVQAEGSAISV